MGLFGVRDGYKVFKFASTTVVMTLILSILLLLPGQQAQAATSWVNGIYVGQAVGGKAVNIRDGNGNHRVLPLAPYVSVNINDGGARLGDLVNGQQVNLTLEYGKVSAIRGITMESYDIYPSTKSKTKIVRGEVRHINLTKEEITVSSDGEWVTCSFDDYTVMLRDRALIPRERINVGDSILASTEGGRYLSRIEIFGSNSGVKDIFRGRIAGVNPISSQLVLKDVNSFFYGGWYSEASTILLDIDSKAPIYKDHAPISWDDLRKTNLGQEVYVAVSDNYKGYKGVKLFIKSGPAKGYNNFIRELDLAAGYVALEGGEGGGSFGPGTISIKNGKLVEEDSFDENSHIFLETNLKGDFEESALILSSDFYPRDYEFVRGEIRDIYDDGIELRAYERYQGNDWAEEKRYRSWIDLKLSPEAGIVDARDEDNINLVNYEDFIYARFTNEYRGDYLVSQLQDGLVQAVIIHRGEYMDDNGDIRSINPFYGDKVSLARISSVTGNKIVLDRIQDWSPPLKRWRTSYHNVALYVESTLIFDENGRRVESGTLHPQDIIYAVHDMKKATIIFVQ